MNIEDLKKENEELRKQLKQHEGLLNQYEQEKNDAKKERDQLKASCDKFSNAEILQKNFEKENTELKAAIVKKDEAIKLIFDWYDSGALIESSKFANAIDKLRQTLSPTITK